MIQGQKRRKAEAAALPTLPGAPRFSRTLGLGSSLCPSVPGDGTSFPLFLSPGSFFIHHGFLEPSPLLEKWSLLTLILGLSNEEYLQRPTLVPFASAYPQPCTKTHPSAVPCTDGRAGTGGNSTWRRVHVLVRSGRLLPPQPPGPLDCDLLQILSLKISQLHPASLQCLCPTLVATRIASCLHFCKNSLAALWPPVLAPFPSTLHCEA